MVQLHWNIIVYGIVILISIFMLIVLYISEQPAGDWGGGKNKYEFGSSGWVLLVIIIIYTLIWGGFFWW